MNTTTIWINCISREWSIYYMTASKSTKWISGIAFFLDKMNIGSDEANIVLNICLLKYEAWPIQQSDMRRDGIHMYVCMDGMNSKYCFNASNPSKIKRTPIWHWHRQMLFIRILIHFRANIFRALFYGFFLYHTYCASIDLGQLLQYSWRKVRKWVSSIFSRINLNRVIYTSLYWMHLTKFWRWLVGKSHCCPHAIFPGWNCFKFCVIIKKKCEWETFALFVGAASI